MFEESSQSLGAQTPGQWENYHCPGGNPAASEDATKKEDTDHGSK